MAQLTEVLRLNRALWMQVYARQCRALELGGFDHAQLEATLIADGALELAEEDPATASAMLQAAVELLLTMSPCQPHGALQVEWARRLRGAPGSSQMETVADCEFGSVALSLLGRDQRGSG